MNINDSSPADVLIWDQYVTMSDVHTFEDGNHLAQPVDMGHTGGIETNTTYVQEQPVTFKHGNTMLGMDLSMNAYSEV